MFDKFCHVVADPCVVIKDLQGSEDSSLGNADLRIVAVLKYTVMKLY